MPASNPSPLLDDSKNQDEVFAQAFSILQEAITQKAFPAASTSITHRGNLIARKALGTFTYEPSEEIAEGGDLDLKSATRKPGAPFLASFARSGEGAPSFASLAKSGRGTVDPATLFDLSSLTKVVATTPMAMLLYERGLLDLDAPISAMVPEFTRDPEKDPRRLEVTLRMLLSHSSGLPAYEKLFLKAHTRPELLAAAFITPLAANPATKAIYSDIGFIILGIALERLADESLDRFCHREIFAPLAMTNTTFNPPREIRPKIPPTADERLRGNEECSKEECGKEECGAGAPAREMPAAQPPQSASHQARSTFREKIIQGEVQDENASILGGVAAHAGLFSSAEDLAKFANVMLNAGRPILRPETVSLFTRRESAPEGTSRTLGWDTPSAPSQSGKYFSPGSYGHLGYTGTSLWIDPARQLSITLLTNRTWPDCFNKAIKQVRPKFHNAVIEALNKD